MRERPTRVLRLHKDIYLPVVLMARAAGVSVERVVEIAFRRFATLTIEQKIACMHRWRLSPGYTTGRALTENKPYFGKEPVGTMIRKLPWYVRTTTWLVRHAQVALSRLFRPGDPPGLA